MNKKHGFTLSEVLITLGIIGIVAALSAPALVQNSANAKIGPTLAKVVSTIENANQKMMLDAGNNDLQDAVSNLDGSYVENLAKYISGSTYKTTWGQNGISSSFSPALKSYNGNSYGSGQLAGFYDFSFSDSIDIKIMTIGSSYSSKGSFKGRYAVVFIDINGIENSPNTIGKDVFEFYIDRNGNVIPLGGKAWAFVNNKSEADWKTTCSSSTVTNGESCAGSIFDNNLKVIY